MPRDKRQLPGEIRDGLVMYEGGTTWHYLVRWRGKIKRGDTKCEGRSTAATWLKAERKKWPLEEQGLIGAGVPTLKALWAEWDRLKASSVSSSHRRYMKGVIHAHTGKYLDLPAGQLTVAAFEELRHAYLTSTGAGPKRNGGHVVRKHTEGGWNKAAGQIRALFRWAVGMKKLLEVPFKVELLPVSLKNRGVLWPERVQAFLVVVDGMRKYQEHDPVPQMSVAIRLMIGAGLREAEALHMEWDRVDWRRHVLIVAQAVATGRKVKDRTIREIPMVSWLETYLLKWWAHCKRPARGLVLFTREEGAHAEGSTTKAVRKGAQSLEIIGLTPHRLRATFATNLFEVGAELSQIQQMLGHEKPEVTMRYILQRPKDQAASLELAAAAMGFKMPDRVPLAPDDKK